MQLRPPVRRFPTTQGNFSITEPAGRPPISPQNKGLGSRLIYSSNSAAGLFRIGSETNLAAGPGVAIREALLWRRKWQRRSFTEGYKKHCSFHASSRVKILQLIATAS